MEGRNVAEVLDGLDTAGRYLSEILVGRGTVGWTPGGIRTILTGVGIVPTSFFLACYFGFAPPRFANVPCFFGRGDVAGPLRVLLSSLVPGSLDFRAILDALSVVVLVVCVVYRFCPGRLGAATAPCMYVLCCVCVV